MATGLHQADDERAGEGSPHAAEAADDDHGEGLHDQVDAHLVDGGGGRDDQRAAHGAQRHAEREDARVHAGHVHAERLAISRFSAVARTMRPKRRAGEEPAHAERDERRRRR